MNHKLVEELSLNHWPPLSTLLYDGWVLRFAEGYTKRANSIQPLYASTCELYEKIAVCEQMYSTNRLPTIYKITPFVCPAHLDSVLEKAGYSIADPTSVQVLQLDSIREPRAISGTVTTNERVTSDWVAQLCRLNNVADTNRNAMEQMLANIRTKAGFVSLYFAEQVVACGFGVIERGYIGLYDIVTDKSYRNRGFGEQMILHLLQWGKEHGARYSYLAVVRNNEPARKLYSKIGYSEMYSYWYRVKDTR